MVHLIAGGRFKDIKLLGSEHPLQRMRTECAGCNAESRTDRSKYENVRFTLPPTFGNTASTVQPVPSLDKSYPRKCFILAIHPMGNRLSRYDDLGLLYRQ